MPPFAVSRALVVALTLVVALVRRRSPLQLWTQWDGQWYLGIAAHGYHWGIHGKPGLAFYPLYPLLVRILTGAGIPSIVAALVITNVAYLGALFYLYRIVEQEQGVQPARRTLWLLSLFPTAFFFLAPYSESLFLLCAVAAIYHARRGDVGIAGIATAAAIMTRPTGLIVLPAVLIALHWQSQSRWRSIENLHRSAVVTLPTVLALAGYLAYLSVQRLSIATLLTAQQSWHRGLTFPWTGFTASLQWLASHGTTNPPWALENVLQLGVAVVFLVLTIVAWRDLPAALRVYCLGFWALVLISPEWRNGYYAPFSSVDRFVLALFPLAAWAAAKIPRNVFRALLTGGTALMVAAATIHLAGGWVG